MSLYRGSPNKDIDVLKPQPCFSPEQEFLGEFVFASRSKQQAAAYMLGSLGCPVGVSVTTQPPEVTIFMDPKSFRQIDQGGAVYEVPDDTFEVSPQTELAAHESVSRSPVTWTEKTAYDSCEEALGILGVKLTFKSPEDFPNFSKVI